MKSHTTIADICLIVLLGVIHPFSPFIHTKKSMKMNDKVTVYVHQRPSDDSLQSAIQLADKEMDEMRYYFLQPPCG